MRNLTAFTALAAGAALLATPAIATLIQVPAHIQAAVNDAGRPAEDKADDENRKPAAMLVFAEVEPGDEIAEYIPGGGYFTRIFSKAVGAGGHVYTIQSAGPRGQAARDLAANPAYSNVTVIEGDVATARPSQRVDLVWTSQNYHDIPTERRGPLNETAYRMLKPGGTYIVLDHAARTGSGLADVGLHRIDQNLVIAEVTSAGFELAGEDASLRNPADPRTATVFDPSIRGDTDQFILKFRKPN